MKVLTDQMLNDNEAWGQRLRDCLTGWWSPKNYSVARVLNGPRSFSSTWKRRTVVSCSVLWSKTRAAGNWQSDPRLTALSVCFQLARISRPSLVGHVDGEMTLGPELLYRIVALNVATRSHTNSVKELLSSLYDIMLHNNSKWQFVFFRLMFFVVWCVGSYCSVRG